MDSVLAWCAGGPGSIPAVGKSKKVAIFRWFFLAKGGRLKKWSQTREFCIIYRLHAVNIISTLATPSMEQT